MFNYSCPFNDAHGMIRFLQGNVRRRRDNMNVVHGPEGSGKSTTTGQICRRINPKFDLEEDTIFTTNHLLDVLEDCRKGQLINIDEGINVFHNQDWNTWQAKALTKLIRQMRIMASTWFISCPDFEGLHPYLRDYRVRLRLYHQPVWDQDGMGNGPAKILWKDEWFDYKEQAVVTRWIDLENDLSVESLDDDPQHAAYDRKKEKNFRDLVSGIRDRLSLEDDKTTPTRKRRRKTARRTSPPTTT